MNNHIETEIQKHPIEPTVLTDVAEGVLRLKTNGENTAFANRREEKIKLRGGLNKYNRVSELYRLSSENPEDQDIKKELVWEEYLGVRTVIYGTDQTTIFLSSLSEKAKQEEIDRLYNFIFEGHEEQTYFFEKLTKEVFHINVSIAEGKQKLDTQEKKDVACSQLIAKLPPITLWKKKDFFLLFIEPEEDKNQPATAGSTETQNKEENVIDEATPLSTEEQTHTNHSVVEAPKNEAQTDIVAVDITPADEAPAETEEEKTKETIDEMVVKLVEISKSFNQGIGLYHDVNNEKSTTLSRLYPTLKTIVAEELAGTISKLPESDIKNIFTERENIDKLIDSVITERTKAEANITAIMGSAVFTNGELTMLRAINTRAVMRKTLGEFASDLDKERLDEIINIITPLCVFLKAQNAE